MTTTHPAPSSDPRFALTARVRCTCAPDLCATCADEGGHVPLWARGITDNPITTVGPDRAILISYLPGADLFIATTGHGLSTSSCAGETAQAVYDEAIAALEGTATPDVEPGTENDDHSAGEPCGCPVAVIEAEGHQEGCDADGFDSWAAAEHLPVTTELDGFEVVDDAGGLSSFWRAHP